MTRKLTIGLGLSASALLLAGCSGVSVDQIEESTNEMNDAFQNIINIIFRYIRYFLLF